MRPLRIVRLSHDCHVPLDHLDTGNTWTCETCRQRWRCAKTRDGYKTAIRVSWFRWLTGLD